MSKSKRLPAHAIRPIAEKVAEKLSPYCDRICIAGSLRRHPDDDHVEVGDVELVAIPKIGTQRGLFETGVVANHLHVYLDGLIATHKIRHNNPKRWGKKLRSFVVVTDHARHIKFDLFMCEPDTWGSTLIIRTGSAKFSKWLVTKRSEGGAMPNNMHHAGNRLHSTIDGETYTISVPEEEDFFRALGLPVIPVTDRERKRWLKYAR